MPGYLSSAIYRSWLILSIVFATFLLHQDNVVSGEEQDTQMEQVFPTPLMRMVNASIAASLREQTDNVSSVVSNTSLADLLNDNSTQQMQIRYRERKKKERLHLIQRLILVKLGITRQPNVTSLSEEGRRRMLDWLNCTRISHQHGASDSSNSMDTADDSQSGTSCGNDDDPC